MAALAGAGLAAGLLAAGLFLAEGLFARLDMSVNSRERRPDIVRDREGKTGDELEKRMGESVRIVPRSGKETRQGVARDMATLSALLYAHRHNAHV